MSETDLDVVALGNAIVDAVCRVDDNFLKVNNFKKGKMKLMLLNRCHIFFLQWNKQQIQLQHSIIKQIYEQYSEKNISALNQN